MYIAGQVNEPKLTLLPKLCNMMRLRKLAGDQREEKLVPQLLHWSCLLDVTLVFGDDKYGITIIALQLVLKLGLWLEMALCDTAPLL